MSSIINTFLKLALKRILRNETLKNTYLREKCTCSKLIFTINNLVPVTWTIRIWAAIIQVLNEFDSSIHRAQRTPGLPAVLMFGISDWYWFQSVTVRVVAVSRIVSAVRIILAWLKLTVRRVRVILIVAAIWVTVRRWTSSSAISSAAFTFAALASAAFASSAFAPSAFARRAFASSALASSAFASSAFPSSAFLQGPGLLAFALAIKIAVTGFTICIWAHSPLVFGRFAIPFTVTKNYQYSLNIFNLILQRHNNHMKRGFYILILISNWDSRLIETPLFSVPLSIWQKDEMLIWL